MENRHFTSYDLKALIRWDTTWKEFWGEGDFNLDFTAERYKPQLDDAKALIMNIRKRNPKVMDFYEDWAQIFDSYVLTPPVFIGDGPDPKEPDKIRNHYRFKEKVTFQFGPGDDDVAVYNIFNAILDIAREDTYRDAEICSGIIDFDRILQDISSFEKGDFSHEYYGWKWTDKTKLSAFSVLYENGFGPLITKDEYPEARVVMDEMCDRGIIEALDRRAYDAYGGDKLYPCDWVLSRDSLLTLMNSSEVSEKHKGYYANTLGYIYYYGRCTNNIPDYASALKYYMVGGAVGVIESIYKISDMLRGGKGVPRNIEAADNIVRWAYDQSRKNFLTSENPADFPDVALRLSSMEKDKGNILEAYRLLLEADYVIQNRLQYGYYGDDNVAMSIRKNMTEIRRSHGKEIAEYNPNNLVYKPIGDLIATNTPVRGVHIKCEDGGTRFIFACNYESPAIFVEFINSDYIIVLKQVCYQFEGVKKLHISRNTSSFLFDSMSVSVDENDDIHIVFKRDNHKTCEIITENVSVCLPLTPEEDKDDSVHHFASCSFTEDGRTYDYLADGMDVKVGDKAIVDSWEGEAEVFVQDVFDLDMDELPIPFEKYKSLKRLL